MSKINQNIQYNLNQRHPNFKAEQMPQFMYPQQIAENAIPETQTQELTLPEIYNDINNTKKPKTFKETVKKIDMFQMFYPWLEHPVLMAGTTAATLYSIDKLTNAWSGEYGNSLLGKADNLGVKIENSKFMQKDFVKKGLNLFNRGYNKIATPIKNNSWFRAMIDTPCSPEWPMGKIEMISQNRRIIQDDFLTIVENLKLNSTDAINFNNIGSKKDEIEMLKKLFNVTDISKITQEEATSAILLKRIGKTDSEILKIAKSGKGNIEAVKDEIRKLMGMTINELSDIKGDEAEKLTQKVFKAAEKSKGKVWVSDGSGLLKRHIGMDGVYNRMYSISDNVKSKLGKGFSYCLQKIHRGFTFGGGKGGMILFIVPHLANAIVNTIKAEPEEKLSTAVQGGIGAISWVITMPLATKMLYALGGLKNIGLSKDIVAQIDSLKEQYHAGKFNGTRKELKQQIKNLRKVKDQNLLTKMARKIAGFFTSDLGMIKPIASESMFAKIKGNVGNFMRNCGNIPVRFIAAFALMGALDGVITKFLSGIFGRAHSEEDLKMHQEEKERQEVFAKEDLRARVIQAQQNKISGINNKPVENAMLVPNYAKTENIEENATVEEEFVAPIKQESKIKFPPEEKETVANTNTDPVQEEKDNYTYIPSNKPSNEVLSQKRSEIDTYTYIPSSENTIKTNEVKTNKYIPSQKAANINKTFDNSGLQDALNRADKAERQAIQILNGKFEGI